MILPETNLSQKVNFSLQLPGNPEARFYLEARKEAVPTSHIKIWIHKLVLSVKECKGLKDLY